MAAFAVVAAARVAHAQVPLSTSSSETSDLHPTPSRAARSLELSQLTIPAELGYILETHPAASADRPVIIHIQEAHTNYEGQQHLIGILESLIKQHGLKLILVEGGEGDVGLAYMRSFGPPENRKQVADKYLKLGVISAEEYLDITSDYLLILWGVEQQQLYDENVEAFLGAESIQASLTPVLASVRQAVESLKSVLFDPALTDLEAKAKAFEEQQLGLGDYAELLERLANLKQVGMESYPNLAQFLEARHLERAIQLPQVKQEQQALVATLSQVASEAKLEELIAKGKGMKEGTVKPAEFYAGLEQLAASSHVSLETYPQLAGYIRYITHSAQIEPTVLSEELDAFAKTLRQTFTDTPESQTLNAIAQELDLVQKLVEFGLSPEEHQRLDAVDLPTLASRWDSFLNAQLARHGLPAQSFAPLGELETHLSSLQRFYQVAGQRDERLVQHALAKLQETGEPLAVLITGGFHAPKITSLLTEQGVGTVLVTPKVTAATNEALYRAVVKYKSGHGSFDEVVAIANQSDSLGASTPQH